MRNRNLSLTVSVTAVIVVGFVAYLIGSRQRAPAAQSETPTASADMSSHHGGTARGAYTDLQSMVGKPAPAFSLTDRDGKTYSRDSLQGKNVVLFFNEGLMCYPSCWNQTVSLAQDKRFAKEDTVVLSIVVDQPSEWQRAIAKMPALAEATVVFDTDGSASNAFGMLKTESSMHYGQYPGHSYVVIDKQGIIRHILDDPRMGIHNDQLVAELAKANA